MCLTAVLQDSVSQLNFRAIVDGLGGVLFKYPFRCALLGIFLPKYIPF